MKHVVCDRAWRVEAARDGRLSGTDDAALAPHLSGCATCRGEQRELDALASDLCARDTGVDEVALRRLRQQTLEKANALMTASASQGSTRRSAAWSVTACVLVTIATNTLWFARANQDDSPRSAVSVVADHEAKWQRSLDPHVERVDLSSGTLLFRVARKATDPRLVVRVPDGVIEDLGTVFSVSVRDGRTSEIAVREGEVMFHRRGASALHLVAGATWTPSEHPTPVQGPTAAPPGEPVRADVLLAKPKSALAPRHERRSVRRAIRRTVHPAHEMSDTGEDAAYLRVIVLLRGHHNDEARLAALAYLQAFPAGFRRIEITRVAGLLQETAAGKTGHPPTSGVDRAPDGPP